MKSLKRVIALMLALLLVIAPVNSVFATSVDPTESTTTTDGTTEPSEGVEDSTNPSTGVTDPSTEPQDPSTEPQEPSTEPSEPGTDPVVSVIDIAFDYSEDISESGWYTKTGDLSVVFKNTTEFEEVKLSYTIGGAEPVNVDVQLQDDGSYKGLVSSLSDGAYLFSAYAKGIDGIDCSKTFELKVDTKDVSTANTSTEGLFVLEGVGYAKESFVIKGFEDATSGIKTIITMSGSDAVSEYSAEDSIVITSNVTSIILVDSAGNSLDVTVKEALSHLCSDVVFDSGIPAISISKESEPAYKSDTKEYYNSKFSMLVSVSDDNLNEVVVYVDGKLLGNSVILGNKVTLAYSFEEPKEYVVEITVTDKAGNSVTETVSFVVDTIAPEKGSLGATGTWFNVNGKLYSSSTIVIDGVCEDALSGVGSIEVVKNGSVVSTSLPYNIVESGNYVVKVYDNVGNCSEFTVADLSETDATEIVVDSDAPNVSINLENSTTPNYSGSRGYWYTSNPVIDVTATDSNIKGVSIVIAVDGEELTIKYIEESVDGLKVDTSAYEGKNFVLRVIAEDLSGNSSSAEYAYSVDNAAPYSIKVTAPSPNVEKGGNVYFVNTFDIAITAEDDGFGDLVYYLNDSSNKSGVFAGIGAGEHYIKVADGLGNVIDAKPLSEYLGWGSNHVVVVTNAPSIEASGFNGKWVSSSPAYVMNASDPYGVDYYNVSVNDAIIVEKAYDNVNTTSALISFNLDGIEPQDNGLYNIKVYVRNNAGLVTEWSDTVSVDTTAPDIGSIKADGKWNEVDGEVFSSGAITISGSANDSQSGVTGIVVYKNGEEVSNILPYSIVESGSYHIVITDAVGNSSTHYLKDVLGTSSNNIVIDGELPSVGFDPNTTIPTTVHSGVNWFNSYPVISVNASDSSKIHVTVVVTVDDTNYTDYDGYYSGNFEYSVNTEKYAGKHYIVTVSAVDNSGNSCSVSYNFSVDISKPERGSLGVSSEYVNTDYVAFTNNGFVFSGQAIDVDSGISSLEIYNNGVKCYESTDGSISYSVFEESESGSYVIVVRDRVGNVSTFNASDLLGSTSNNFVVDKTAPVISRVDKEVETSAGWYNYAPSLKFSVSDSYVKSYTVTVNGVAVREGTSSEEFQLNMSSYLNMSVSVKIYAVDMAGNSSEYSYVYQHDNAAPSNISASSSNLYTEKEGFVYFTDKLIINVSADDFGYGDLSYYLNNVANNSGEFSINSNGEYYVRVVDGLGNTSESIPLSELLGWKSNNIIFDSGSPTVTAYRYNGQWVSKAPVYNFGFSDNYGIDTVTIIVNGVELYSKKYDDVSATNESASVNIADAEINVDGSYSIVVTVTDNSGLSTTWSDIVYIDDTAPVVENFEISGATNAVGSSINGKDSYGFFFNGDGKVTVIVSDSGASSGIKSIWTLLEGYEWVEHTLISNNSVVISVPEDFKGYLKAYAVDSVGNTGDINMPDLLISESKKSHDDFNKLVITLPNTPYSDKNGMPLYNSDITVSVIAGCEISGFQGMEWGINDFSEVINSLTGTSYDKNLITEIPQGLGIVGNENGLKVVVRVTDMVGHTSEGYKFFSIDKDIPLIEVSFNTTTDNSHYNVTRTATIVVTERNFDPSMFTVSGVYGELGDWSNSGDKWTNTITFKDNGEYQFILNCTDKAGNAAVQYKSEEFVVDKVKPIINRIDTNVESKGDWYNYSPELKFSVTESYIEEYVVFINDTVVSNGSSSSVVVDTSNYTNIPVTVRVVVRDKAGNFDEYVYSYNHDNQPPVNIGVVSESPATQKDGTVYFNSHFNITVEAEDLGYGDITYYLNDISSKDGRFTIYESGEYFIKVVDGLGHESKTVELGSYCGWKGNNVIINDTAPVIKWDTFGGSWIDNTCVYDVSVSSKVGIDSIVVTVNGTEVIKNDYNGLDSLNADIKVDISKAVMSGDSSYKTVITVTDNSGLVTTVNDTVYVDLNVAEIGSMSVDGNWEIHGGKLFTKGAITINGTPVDKESGISVIEVLRDGTVVGTLPYTITESGVYGVRVTDNVGNQIVYSFADIAGTPTSNIVWDDTFPDVYFDLEQSDKPQYIDGETYWYAKNPMIYIGMTDTNMESVSVVVTIDGVKTVVVDDILENGIYAIDTSYSSGTEFKIVAMARDKSGNVREDSYEFRVDSSKPSKGSIAVSAYPEWVEIDGYVYIRGGFRISGVPADIGSGIKRVYVYSSVNGSVGMYEYISEVDILVDRETLPESYTIEIEDNVGNIYSVTAGELLGSSSNRFIVDLTDPTIVRTDDNVETKTGWFNYEPVFTFDINDKYIKEYTVYINNDVVLTGSSSESVSVNTSNYKNQKVTVRIEVADKAGNTSEYSYSYEHDNTPPENVNIEMSSPVTQKGDNVYYNDSVDIVITSTDSAYGNIGYYINGARIDEGKYTIAKSGEYSFEVVDGLGNSTGVITLKEFLKWHGNNVVIDSNNPIIESNKFNNAWIKGIGSYKVSISDNLGINSIVATVNGIKVVDISTSVTNDIEEVIEIDTTMAEPNVDGSFKTVVIVTDNSGLVTTWEDVVYVDNTAPVVDKFVVYGDVNRLSTEDAYGYFFNGGGVIEIMCSDATPSSGLKSVFVRLDGYDWAELEVNESGVVAIEVPENFKGSIEAYTVDKVGNVGATKSPAKLISETVENHIKNQKIEITMPETPYTDVNGLPLYNTDVVADLLIGCDWSGLQQLEWGVDSLTTITDFSNGVFDENIVVQYNQKLPLAGNSNGLVLSVNVVDWSNHKFSKEVSFSIDKDAPVIGVVFDNTVENGYYKNTRVATITVVERNFEPSKFIITGSSGELGTWSEDNGVWTNNIIFSEDGDYAFTLNCTDMAGNVAEQYVSEEFTVDKTLPIMTVTWDNNSYKNEMYYKSARTATITVVEHNFDSSLFTLTGSGSLSKWVSDGDIHTSKVKFDGDGEYNFSITGLDLAGNSIESDYNSGRFIVDLTAPVITIGHVSQGVSYKNDVEFVVTVSDTYINEGSKVFLSGKLHEEVEISGQFVGQTGTFSYTDFPENEDVDDVYTIKVISVDNAGNVTEDSITFSVNRFGSKYSFYDAVYLGNYLGEPKDIEISEVNVDRLDISKVVVSITRDGKEIKVADEWVNIYESEVDCKYLYKYAISKDAFTGDGKYSVTIMSEAEEGTKYTCASEQYDFIVDKSKPVVIISGVEDGEDYREYNRTIAVDIRDLSGISSLKFFVNGEEVTDYTENDGIYNLVVGESSEVQSITVEVIDRAGNKSTTTVGNFLITSNLMVYLINQVWFLALIAIILFVIILMIILLLLGRRKDKDDEKAALAASGELYRSSTAGSGSSGTTGATGNENQILSGDAPTVDNSTVTAEDISTSVMEDDSDVTSTGFMDDSDGTTGIM